MWKIALLVILCSSGIIGASVWDTLTKLVDDQTSIPDMLLVVGDYSSSSPLFVHSKVGGSIMMDTAIPVASASKWISGTTIMSLVEKGILSLNDRPQKYITWWTSAVSDPRSTVTLQQLMSFTSGFKGDDYCVGNTSYTTETCVRRIYDNLFLYTPGTHYEYGGNQFLIAGLMAINAANKDWHQIFQAEILDEFGIDSATGARYTPRVNPSIAGGLFTTTTNYMKILQGIYNKTLLQPATITLMQTDYTTSVTFSETPFPPTVVGQWHYGIGEWIECYNKTFTPACTQNYTVSSAGAFGFYPWIDRTNNYYAILATNNPAGGGIASILLTEPWKPIIVSALRELRPTPKPPLSPTYKPTSLPTVKPTPKPSPSPTKKPTLSPSIKPTSPPTIKATRPPTSKPTPRPTRRP